MRNSPISSRIRSEMMIVSRVAPVQTLSGDPIGIVNDAKIAIQTSHDALKTLGLNASTVTRLVWYVRNSGSKKREVEEFLHRQAFDVASADVEVHFVDTLSSADARLELDVVSHLTIAMNQDENRLKDF